MRQSPLRAEPSTPSGSQPSACANMKAWVGPRAASVSAMTASSLHFSESMQSRRKGWKANCQESSRQACATCSARPSRPNVATLCAICDGAWLPVFPDRIILASVTASSLSASASVKTRCLPWTSTSENHCLKPLISEGETLSPSWRNADAVALSAVPVPGCVLPKPPFVPTAPPGPGNSNSRSGVRVSAETNINNALRCCSSSGQTRSTTLVSAPASSTTSIGDGPCRGAACNSSGLMLAWAPSAAGSGCIKRCSALPSAEYMECATTAAFRYCWLEKCRA
mmetsp:Transcript_21964/g.60790  ORF Transcript_21964/g.60790 Transcript_21964/m.60790 type:complete len:282 (-) Transcript_21964:1213-2058(-)